MEVVLYNIREMVVAVVVLVVVVVVVVVVGAAAAASAVELLMTPSHLKDKNFKNPHCHSHQSSWSKLHGRK